MVERSILLGVYGPGAYNVSHAFFFPFRRTISRTRAAHVSILHTSMNDSVRTPRCPFWLAPHPLLVGRLLAAGAGKYDDLTGAKRNKANSVSFSNKKTRKWQNVGGVPVLGAGCSTRARPLHPLALSPCRSTCR